MSYGLLLGFLSGVATATGSLFVKLADDATVLQLTFFRNVIMMVILGTLLVLSGDLGSLFYMPVKTFALMLLKSVASFVGLATIYAVYQLMPLGDAAAIAGSAPIFTGLFGALILGETWTFVHIFLSLVCWLGVALVAQTNLNDTETPENLQTIDSSTAYVKIVLAVVAPMSIAISLVLSRKVTRTGKVLHLMLVTFFGISCCSLIAMTVTEGVHLPGVSTWKYIACDAIAGLLSQWLLTKALSQEKAAPVVLLRNSRVIVAFIYQTLIYHQAPTLQSLAGTFIIIASAAMVTLLN